MKAAVTIRSLCAAITLGLAASAPAASDVPSTDGVPVRSHWRPTPRPTGKTRQELERELKCLRNRWTRTRDELLYWRDKVYDKNVVFVPANVVGLTGTRPVAVGRDVAIECLTQLHKKLTDSGKKTPSLQDLISRTFRYSNATKHKLFHGTMPRLERELRAIYKRYQEVLRELEKLPIPY